MHFGSCISADPLESSPSNQLTSGAQETLLDQIVMLTATRVLPQLCESLPVLCRLRSFWRMTGPFHLTTLSESGG
jgi:hypothetical protein